MRTAMAALAVALVVLVCSCGSSGRSSGTIAAQSGPRTVLIYEARGGGRSVTPAKMRASVAIMRKRADGIGAADVIRQSGTSRITVELAGSSSPEESQLAKTAQLLFYDWEPNVIGASGKPEPRETTVTGGENAGAVQYGLPEYDAVLRAKRRAPILRSSDTTWSRGCTPAQHEGCIYGSWYLLEPKHEMVLGGPEETKQDLYTDYKVPPGAKVKAVRVNPGTVLVQARAVESATGQITQRSPNSYYVLNDDPVLAGADVTNPRQGFDEGLGGIAAPNVTFGFTDRGKNAFEKLTKEIAHRGERAQLQGASNEAALQHFAVVLDGQLITTPSIEYTHYPEGIDASRGSEISGAFTVSSARELAAVLRSGALPLRFVLVSDARR
jgi:SecD/SecF fusion protein